MNDISFSEVRILRHYPHVEGSSAVVRFRRSMPFWNLRERSQSTGNCDTCFHDVALTRQGGTLSGNGSTTTGDFLYLAFTSNGELWEFERSFSQLKRILTVAEICNLCANMLMDQSLWALTVNASARNRHCFSAEHVNVRPPCINAIAGNVPGNVSSRLSTHVWLSLLSLNTAQVNDSFIRKHISQHFFTRRTGMQIGHPCFPV